MRDAIPLSKLSVLDCPEPSSFNNGTIHYDGTSTGSIVKYVCNAGYSIEGVNNRTCLSSGNWDGEVPVCYPGSAKIC